MRQLMGNQPPSFVRPWSEPTCTEHDIVTRSVGMGVHVPRRLLSRCIRMHPHLRKVVTEVLFHVLA